ncbi:MAG TPA: histidinol dehydrogenase [Acidimicrobiia bacterium]|nr:histidinol dehydrogenase [Acidimicrobiia bacterium]
MKILDTTKSALDLPSLLERTSSDTGLLVSEIISQVRQYGDRALVEYSAKFDGIVDGEKPRVMNRSELETYCKNVASKTLTDSQKAAIDKAIENVSWCATKSAPKNWTDTGPDGQIVGERFTAFNRVACYVPQGSFPLVSTAIHTAAIANTAGVNEIVMVTSPSENDLNPAVAYAALNSGVTEIVFVGGAQGIAAVALGTETIEKVDFICGPGNQYVAEAKRALFGTVGIDMVAGPSEVFVIADVTADPYSVACDLVAQAEHGSGMEASVLLTDSMELIYAVEIELEKLQNEITDNPGFQSVWENSLYLVLTDSISKAIKISNDCAPEHVEIQTENYLEDSAKVTNAGAVFIGGYSAEPLGDFVAGPSHVLPTNSSARFTSGLSAASFFTRTSVIEIGESAYEKLSGASKEFADMEGLTGHGLSSVARRKDTESYKNE